MADPGRRLAVPVDLDAYCARIGYSGPRTPTIGTLRALHALHPAVIPFENIDVLLDRGIDIAPASVDAKLIAGRRGGYCYEHNGLFKRVLQAIGFSVEGLAARVRWMVPPGSGPRPRTHMALRVTIDGTPWLADVGFGACVPTVPLRIDADAPQESGHETFRVRSSGEGATVEVLVADRWEALYDLSPEPMLDVDYQLGNWFVSAHPQSHFRHVLMAGRVTPDARYTLLNGRFTVRSPGGETERRLLDADALESVLAREFGLPVRPDWRPLIERIAASGEPD